MKTKYNIYDLKPVKTKGGTAIRFSFRETKPDGSAITLFGCLCGLNEKGYWVWPPRGAYGHNIIEWNEEMKQILLSALADNKILNLLEPKRHPKDEVKFEDIEWEK